MNLEPIRDLAANKLAKPVLLTKIHSPKLLFAAGVAGVIGGVVLACRATLKVNETLSVAEEQLATLEIRVDRDDVDHDPEYSQEQYHKDVSRVKIKLVVDVVKPYIPAVVLLGTSIAALTGSHVILSKRNTGLMAAYAGLDQAFKQYRDRVKEEYGADTDRKFALGGEDVVVDEKLADGSTKSILKTKFPVDGKKGSPYAALFDEKSKRFTHEPGMIPHVLAMLQSQVNDKLRARGYLYLNEVLEVLDLPQMEAGQHVGWIYTHDPKDNPGDNYITFGVTNADADFYEDWLDGREKAIWLDFNVAGVIHNLISWGASTK